MPDRTRRILHFRFRDDLTQTEIAQRVDISQMHVSRIIRQALAQLRASIPDEEG
jgi:RNA polymerase sigma-B factor